jgi:type IV pilus assembly protein PilA
MKTKKNKKGFTLAELLIVVAIIAVLVAIAIPVFTSQLEKSRESTDAANIRNAYAEIMVGILEDQSSFTTSQTVQFQQQQAGWQNTDVKTSLEALETNGGSNIGDLAVTFNGTIDNVTASGTAAFSYTAGTSTAHPTLTITIS